MPFVPQPPSYQRPPRRRRGVLLVLVGALIVVIAAGAFMFRQATLQQYLDAHRFTRSTVAFNLAESGLNGALERFHEATLQPGTALHELLLGKGYDELNGSKVDLPSPHLDLLIEVLGSDAAITVRAELDYFRPLHPPEGLRGILPDPREKIGEIRLVSEGTFLGVTRRLVASKQVRIVSVVAPVLSKFTLFVRERGDEDINTLSYRRLQPKDGFYQGGEAASPVVLYHRTDPVPAIEEGRFLPLAEQFAESDPDDGGLVYLGGDEPWYFNLVHGSGAGPFEELFHLRRSRYIFDSERSGISKEIGLTFGLYEGILQSPKFGANRAPANYPRGGGNGEDVTDKTAALHLYGDIRNVSPTVVLGPVFRSFVTMRLLDGLWYPTMSRDDFSRRNDQDTFGGRYDAYEEVMVRVQDEAYNRSYDYISSNSEELGPGGQVTANETPFVPPAILNERGLLRIQPAVAGDAGYLYPRPDRPTPGLCRLVRLEEAGERPLFQGALQDIDGPLLEQMLLAKAVEVVDDQAAFEAAHLKGPNLVVPAVVLIEGGDLELGDLNVTEGAMVVVQGSIDLTGRVVQTRPGHPLTLVSLAGDIRIRTEGKIDAHLIALRGQVSSRGPLEIVGGVAARRLDIRSMVSGKDPKRITYNQDLDPTTTEGAWRHLRVVMDEKVRLYLE